MVAADTRAQATGGDKVLIVGSQVLSSLANFILIALVSQTANLDQFGRLSLVYATYAISLGLLRRSRGDQFLLLASQPGHPDRLAGAYRAYRQWGLATSVGLAVLTALWGQPLVLSAMLLCSVPLLFSLDAVRLAAIGENEGMQAFTVAAAWLGLQVVTTIGIWALDAVTPLAILAAWSLSGVATYLALTAVIWRRHTHICPPGLFTLPVAQGEPESGRLSIMRITMLKEAAAVQGAGAAAPWIIASVIGAGASGPFIAAGQVSGIVQTVANGVRQAMLARLGGRQRSGRSEALVQAAIIAAGGLFFSAVGLVVFEVFSTAIFGPSGQTISTLAAGRMIAMTGAMASVPLVDSLRFVDGFPTLRYRLLMTVSLLAAIVMAAGTGSVGAVVLAEMAGTWLSAGIWLLIWRRATAGAL